MKNLKATYRFFGSIHVLRHKDGRKYPFELLRDFRFVRNGYQRFVVPGRQEWPWWRRGFETDFGSIPGKNSLKRWLEPQDLVPCSEVDESIKHAVWVYDEGPNDKLERICFSDCGVLTMAIKTEALNSTHVRTYSDSGKIIRSVNTECEYIDAIDPTSENRKYVETTKDIQLDYSLLSPEINNSHVEP